MSVFTRESSDKAHEILEDTLTIMVLCDKGIGDIEFFDGAIPATRSMYDGLLVAAYGNGHIGDRRVDEVSIATKNINGSAILAGSAVDEYGCLMGGCELSYFEKKRLANCRTIPSIADDGRILNIDINPFKQRIVKTRVVTVYHSGKTKLNCENYHVLIGNRWAPLWNEKHLAESSYEKVSFGTAVASAACAVRYWRAKIQWGKNKPGISFFTDPTGLKEFFKFRDVAPEKTKRDALVHWVESHWRQNRHDPDVENYVREYLRGKREFGWYGLRVEACIPHDEVKREEKVVGERKKMKALSLDFRAKRMLGGITNS